MSTKQLWPSILILAGVLAAYYISIALNGGAAAQAAFNSADPLLASAPGFVTQPLKAARFQPLKPEMRYILVSIQAFAFTNG